MEEPINKPETYGPLAYEEFRAPEAPDEPPVFVTEELKFVVEDDEKEPHRLRRWLVRGLAAFIWILVAVGGFAYWQGMSIVNEFHAGEKEEVVESALPQLGIEPETSSGLSKATTLLLVGSDIRAGEHGNGRSDTIIVARLYPDRHAVSLLSLPRDLYVNIPGHGYDKINAAYSIGGIKLLIATVREYTGVPIDHFFQVDFFGFAEVVRKFDGVYLPIDQRYHHSNEGLSDYSHYAEINLKPGYQWLNNEDALSWVRFRHHDSDFFRASRQQIFLREIGRQIKASQGDLFELRDIIKIIAKATTSDVSDLDTALRIAETLKEVPPERVYRTVMEGTGTYIGYGYYVAPTDSEKAAVLEQWDRPWDAIRSQGKKPPAQSELKALAALFRLNALGLSTLRPQFSAIRKPSSELAEAWLEAYRYRELSGKEKQRTSDQQQLTADGGEGQAIARSLKVASCSPTALPPGYYWPDSSAARSYRIGEHRASAAYATAGSGKSVLWMWTDWNNPPILDRPDDRIRLGSRSYDLFWESGRLRMIAWSDGGTRAWITNTLRDELSPGEMIALARSCKS